MDNKGQAPPKKGSRKKKAVEASKAQAPKKAKILPRFADKAASRAEKEEKELKLVNFKGQFIRDLKPMLYGFGDVPNPLSETVEVVEDCLLEYIGGVMHSVMQAAGPGKKVNEEELLFALRKNPRMYSRANEMMTLSKEIKEAKQLFDADDDKLVARAEDGEASQ